MSVIMHSVHHNIVPHIAHAVLFGCDFQPRLTLQFPMWLSRIVLCPRMCRVQAQDCLSTGWVLNRCFAWTFRTAGVQGGRGARWGG